MPSGVLMFSGWRTGTPCSWAIFFMPRPVCRVEPRSAPVARSGCVTRPTTECELANNASRVGSANRPVPIMTRRMAIFPMLNGRNRARRRAVLLQRHRTFLQDAFQLGRGRYLALLLGALEILLELFEGVAAGQAGDSAHFVDEQNTIEMIDFVLPQSGF